MRRALAITAVLVSLAFAAAPAQAAPGDLDPGWDTDGLLLGQTGQSGTAADMRADGSFVVGGETGAGRLFVTHLDGSGAIDDTFGFEGTREVFGCGRAVSLVALPDESTLVLSPECLVRLTPEGELDPSFSNDGVVGVRNAADLDVDSQGRALVVEEIRISPNPGVTVTRFSDSGTLDTSYGNAGIALTDQSPYEGVAIDVSGDEALIASTEAGPGLSVVKLDGSGEPDFSWGSGGKAVLEVNSVVSIGDVLAGDSGGASVTGSLGFDGSASYVARFDADGVPDQAFGDAGLARLDGTGPETQTALAMQDDGNLLVAGFTYYFCPGSAGPFCMAQRDATLARLTTSGQLDPTFGQNGYVDLDLDGYDTAWEVLPDGDRAYLLGSAQGRCCNREQEQPARILIARHLLSNGPADFDADGVPGDQCPKRFATSESGCPSYEQSIVVDGLRKTAKVLKIRVHVESEAEACIFPEVPDLERERRGRWILVARGAPATFSGPNFKVKNPKPGPYRLVLAKREVENVGTCKAATPVKL